MESLSEMSICCFFIGASQYSLFDELPRGIDGKFVLVCVLFNISNGEGMFAIIGVHLYYTLNSIDYLVA